jgi:hypothetical protein
MYQNTKTKNKNPIKKYCSGEHKNPMIVLSKGQKNVKSFCNEMRDQFFLSTDLFLVIFPPSQTKATRLGTKNIENTKK